MPDRQTPTLNQQISQAIRTYRPLRTPIGAGFLAIGGLIYTLSWRPGTWLGVVVMLGALGWLGFWLARTQLTIGGRLEARLGADHSWAVNARSYPLYKAVDLYYAAQALAGQCPAGQSLASYHSSSLSSILSAPFNYGGERINVANRLTCKIGYAEEALFARDCFWLIKEGRSVISGPAIIRTRFVGPEGGAAFFMLEVAAPTTDQAATIVTAIGEHASRESIYRNHTIRVVFGPQLRGHYGDEDGNAPMDLVFVEETPIADDEIILDDETHEVIETTVIDFHNRRAELMALGLPGKRGVLFYGPPGTGKTFTCKYIGQRLTQATKLVVTGHALLNMKHICAVARMLQPALVFLEDVDLVFMERDRNPTSTVLGEFIDQLDGFGETDQVIFIMTTNAIERVERAIKDRPGRVSQCLYFGPPGTSLRRRYLNSLLAAYDSSRVDLERIVADTEGVSQAFLKEMVGRAIQLASRNHTLDKGPIQLQTAHLSVALRQMVEGSGRAAQRIIGFRIDSS